MGERFIITSRVSPGRHEEAQMRFRETVSGKPFQQKRFKEQFAELAPLKRPFVKRCY
jgi:hypothetical protein